MSVEDYKGRGKKAPNSITHLGHRVRRARVERSGFLLRDFLHLTVQFGSGRLVEARGLVQSTSAHGFEDAKCAEGVALEL